MTARRAGVVAAAALGLVLAAGVAIGATVLGHVDVAGASWLFVALSGLLAPCAAFTGRRCGPRVPSGGPALPLVAAGTASISTALLAWVLGIAATLVADLSRGTFDPSSWWHVSLIGVLYVLAATTIAVALSLFLTVPMGLVWVWLTRKMIGRA